MSKIVLPLPPGMRHVLACLGAMRHAVNRAVGVVNAKAGPQSEEATDRIGAIAEGAVAYWLNVCPDFTIHPRRGGPDLTWGNVTLDVKASSYANCKLMARRRQWPIEHADLFTLVLVTDAEIALIGWTYANELMVEANRQGDNYAMAQGSLYRPDTLWTALNTLHREKTPATCETPLKSA